MQSQSSSPSKDTTAAALTWLLTRDRAAVTVALALVITIAWIVTATLALDMRWMRLGPSGWTPGYFAAMYAMWVVMMVGMMLPSAAPAIFLFTALRQRARYSGAALIAAGYLACWAAFSLVATSAQWLLARVELLASPMMIQASSGVAASLFVVAGFYQLTPWKTTCLARCRAPAEFFAAYWRPGNLAAFWLGVRHGLYCMGCCWALMALLFAVGAMNLLWVAALAAFVFAEKLFPAGERIARFSAIALISAGLAFLWFDYGGFDGSMGNQGNGIH